MNELVSCAAVRGGLRAATAVLLNNAEYSREAFQDVTAGGPADVASGGTVLPHEDAG